MLRFFLVTLLIVIGMFCKAETLTYTVIHDGKSVGKIHIDRTKVNDVTQYKFESNVVVNMLLTVKVYDKMDVTFKGNQLTNAYLYRTLNGRIRVKNYATWNGSQYNMTDKDDDKSIIKHPIYHTTACLYYIEPSNIPYVFSEKFQKMIAVKSVGNKRYVLNLPNGNKAYYTYTNGVCSLVEAETDWATLKFVLNKHQL
jgi:hypothetical protein